MSKQQVKNGPLAVLRFPRRNLGLLLFAKAVLAALTGNASFPSPNPTLANFGNDVTALDQAETEAETRETGAVQARNAKRLKVMQDLHYLRDYVQFVVETAGVSNAVAAAMIRSAGFALKIVTTPWKPAFAAKNAVLPGTVTLAARRVAPNATYYWQFSGDGVNWTNAPDTVKASTVISGLTSAHTYSFRFRALWRKGQTDWSQIVTLLVH